MGGPHAAQKGYRRNGAQAWQGSTGKFEEGNCGFRPRALWRFPQLPDRAATEAVLLFLQEGATFGSAANAYGDCGPL